MYLKQLENFNSLNRHTKDLNEAARVRSVKTLSNRA